MASSSVSKEDIPRTAKNQVAPLNAGTASADGTNEKGKGQRETAVTISEPTPARGVSKVSWQQATNVDVLSSLNLSRQYSIEDQSGQTLFYGGENVGIVCEFIGQGQRAFSINLYDLDGKFVLKFHQQCSPRLCVLCAECGGGRVNVLLPSGKSIGAVNQISTCCTPTYEILDSTENRVMIIVGKCGRVCCLCPSKAFRAFADVMKDSVLVTEVVATSGRRYIEFKEEMTLEYKILLMAAMLLLEMDYYRSCRGLRRILLIILLVIVGAAWYRFTILEKLDDQAMV